MLLPHRCSTAICLLAHAKQAGDITLMLDTDPNTTKPTGAAIKASTAARRSALSPPAHAACSLHCGAVPERLAQRAPLPPLPGWVLQLPPPTSGAHAPPLAQAVMQPVDNIHPLLLSSAGQAEGAGGGQPAGGRAVLSLQRPWVRAAADRCRPPCSPTAPPCCERGRGARPPATARSGWANPTLPALGGCSCSLNAPPSNLLAPRSTQVPDDGETDGYDEAICPADM